MLAERYFETKTLRRWKGGEGYQKSDPCNKKRKRGFPSSELSCFIRAARCRLACSPTFANATSYMFRRRSVTSRDACLTCVYHPPAGSMRRDCDLK
jgi:hypothetical protein